MLKKLLRSKDSVLFYAVLIALEFAFIFAAPAKELKVTVIDGELEIPLEGAKVFLNENRAVSADTDMDGNAVLVFEDEFDGGNLICQFPGYSQNITKIKGVESELKIAMMISDFLEGKEIIVMRKAEKHTQESGVSVVMTKEQMDTTSRSGLVEDVMSSVSTMPGMTFGGQWNSEPSVRGGYPREMAYTLDGCYLMLPWHWGGAYSIFNPNFVESTKLNNGVYSAEYGRAVSGLLEVNSVMPDDEVHFIFDLNYISSSLFLSAPLGKKAGFIFGAKATYLETLLWTFRNLSSSSATDAVAKAPYIRDFYAKAFYEPADKITFTVNGFFGSDGIGIDQSVENAEDDDGIKTVGEMDYDMYQSILGLDVKWLPTDKVKVDGKLSWNGTFEKFSMDTAETGFVKYNPDFLSQYGSMIPTKDLVNGGYFINTKNSMSEKINSNLFHGKATTEITLADASRIKFGAEEVMTFGSIEEKADVWRELTIGGDYPYYGPVSFNASADNNKSYNTSVFSLWNFGNDDSLVNGEVGLRFDHMLIRGEGVNINTPCDVNPRASVHFVPVRDRGIVDKVVFTTGAGLFSAVPFDSIMVNENVVTGDDIKQDRAIFSVLGSEVELKGDWKFSIEGYFKYYLNRLYVVNNEMDPRNVITQAYTDGKGYTAGFDFMAQKSVGTKWNGYLTYSFIYARYKNPFKPQYSNQRSSREDPLDEWYYPSFHRFNTLNLIVNYKPSPSWTITLKGTLATGTPRTDGDRYCYPVRLADGTVMQRYTRSWFYSDVLRTDISCPVDIRVAHTGTFRRHPKWKWEWYFGAEDIFMNLYSPKGSQKFNQNTGKDAEDSSVNFNIGIPMISMGLRMSFN